MWLMGGGVVILEARGGFGSTFVFVLERNKMCRKYSYSLGYAVSTTANIQPQ